MGVDENGTESGSQPEGLSLPRTGWSPRLRDNKSSFFKEMESELLQSDITEDSRRHAMLNYLAKLDEVASPNPVASTMWSRLTRRARSFTS